MTTISPLPNRFYAIVPALNYPVSIQSQMSRLQGEWVKITMTSVSMSYTSQNAGAICGCFHFDRLHSMTTIGPYTGVLHIFADEIDTSKENMYHWVQGGKNVPIQVVIPREALSAIGGQIEVDVAYNVLANHPEITITSFGCILEFEIF